MANERLRIPIDGPYLNAVGLAMICFARLEWEVVWCCQKFQPDYPQQVNDKTSGMIANDFVALVAHRPEHEAAARLSAAAAKFQQLVKRRNDLVHAQPGTTAENAQRLFRNGAEWTIALIDELSDAFAAANIELNNLRYNTL